MPIYSRRTLRQRLGRDFLRDTVVGQTSGSWGTQAGSLNIIDSSLADPTASGESLYQRHWLRLLGSGTAIATTSYILQDTRVGSFNTGSGAFVSAITAATTIYSGMPFEVHSLISPAEKDRALDNVFENIRIQQEYPIWAIDNDHVYSLGTDIVDILDVRYFSDPTDSLNIGEHKLDWWKFESTATGNQLRINPSLPASYQLILQAILIPSLGASDLATVNIPNADWLLWGAAARAYHLAGRGAPGQEAKYYDEQGAKAAKMFTRLSARFQPKIYRKVQLDEVW